jgi:sec-independent protein translocase protein TatA
MGNLGVPELLIILLIILVFFGAKKIPEIAQGLGKGIREFKNATREAESDGNESAPALPNPVASITCPSCGKAASAEARHCPSCGTSFDAKTCLKCKTVNRPGNKFCSACGTQL